MFKIICLWRKLSVIQLFVSFCQLLVPYHEYTFGASSCNVSQVPFLKTSLTIKLPILIRGFGKLISIAPSAVQVFMKWINFPFDDSRLREKDITCFKRNHSLCETDPSLLGQLSPSENGYPLLQVRSQSL